MNREEKRKQGIKCVGQFGCIVGTHMMLTIPDDIPEEQWNVFIRGATIMVNEIVHEWCKCTNCALHLKNYMVEVESFTEEE